MAMSIPQVPCPECDSPVFFPSGGRPGDKARCPLCDHHFILQSVPVISVQGNAPRSRLPIIGLGVLALALLAALAGLVARRQMTISQTMLAPGETDAVAAMAPEAAPDNSRELERSLREGREALASGNSEVAMGRFREHARLRQVPDEVISGLVEMSATKEKAKAAVEIAAAREQALGQAAMDRKAAFGLALEMARKGLAADDLVAARGAVERAALLDPENPDLAKEHEALLRKERSGQSRESAAVRLRAGEAHLAGERWGEALRDFEAVLAVIPDNAGARAGQQKAIAGLKSLEALEEKRLQYLVHLDDGRKALRDRRFEDADAAFQRAARLFPDEREPRRLQDQVRNDRRDLDNTVTQIIRNAQAMLAQNKPSEAFYRLIDADFLSPRNQQVRRLMADAQQRMAVTQNMNNPFISDPKYQNWMAQGRMALASGNPFMAMEAFQNALAQSNNTDPFARQAFFESRKQADSLGQKAQEFQKVFADAKILHGAKRYGQALPMLENALSLFPGDSRVMEMLEECRYQDLLEKARLALSRDAAETERLADLALRMRPSEITPRNLIKQARAIRFAKVPEPRFPG